LYLRVTVLFFITHQHNTDIAILSVCLSRCGTVSKRLNISPNFFSAYGSPIILVFPVLNVFAKFRRDSRLRVQVGYKNFASFCQIGSVVAASAAQRPPRARSVGRGRTKSVANVSSPCKTIPRKKLSYPEVYASGGGCQHLRPICFFPRENFPW